MLGEDHPSTAASYNNVASNLNAQGRLPEAEPLFQKALEIRKRMLGEDHPDTAGSYNNVATNLYYLGRFQEGFEYAEKAVAIALKRLGPEHPNTKSMLSVLTAIKAKLGQ